MRTLFSPARTARLVLACASVAALGAAHAQMPPMRGEGAARYVCGGIGSDESTAIRAAMKDHPLSLLFARAD
ncbi:MAG: carboxypeptidase regulatory-like domain-containing protein, partial [Variovorax sp.]